MTGQLGVRELGEHAARLASREATGDEEGAAAMRRRVAEVDAELARVSALGDAD